MSNTEDQTPESHGAETSSSQASSSETRSSGFTLLIGFLFVLLLTAVSFMGWKAVEFETTYQHSQHKAQNDSQKLFAQVAQLQAQADQLTAEMIRLKGADRSDWLLAEVEYLLRLANQQAVLGRDAQGAATLLNSADTVLKELNKPADLKGLAKLSDITALRKLIAKERSELLLREGLDREGLYLKLGAFANKLDALSVVDLNKAGPSATDDKLMEGLAAESLADKVTHSLQAVLEEMGGYLRVQKHDQAVTALLAPNEQLYLKRNLNLMLEQAQIAVLQQKQDIYLTSIEKASDWIKKYYLIDDGVKQKLLKELQNFKQVNLEEPLPDISGSLAAIQQLIKKRHLQDN